MMDYRAELQIILDDENLGFEEWISRYPIQECPRLILEYKSFMQKYAIENGDFESVEELQELDDLAERIENFTIDTFAARQQKFNEATILLEKIRGLHAQFMENGSGEILVSEEQVNDLRDIVQYLKSQDLYDEETWKPLLHLI
jgi:hypothetical protein